MAQHFSQEFGVGITGFYFNQLSNDKSPMLNKLGRVVDTLNRARGSLDQSLCPPVGGFQGEAAGVGPIVRYSPKLGGRQVHFIGKWIHEFDVQSRFQGDIGMLSFALNF